MSQANNWRLAMEAERYVDSLQALNANAKGLCKLPSDRAHDRLSEIVQEAKFAAVMASSSLAEDYKLRAARTALNASKRLVERAQAVADQASAVYYDALNEQKSWWRRLVERLTGRHAAKIDALHKEMEKAKTDRWVEESHRQAAAVKLSEIEQNHKAVQAAHRTKWTAEAERLKPQRIAAEAAQDLCQRLPGLAHLGPFGLLELGQQLATAREARRDSECNSQEASGCPLAPTDR